MAQEGLQVTNDFELMNMFVRMALLLSEESVDGCFELNVTEGDDKKKVIKVKVTDVD